MPSIDLTAHAGAVEKPMEKVWDLKFENFGGIVSHRMRAGGI